METNDVYFSLKKMWRGHDLSRFPGRNKRDYPDVSWLSEINECSWNKDELMKVFDVNENRIVDDAWFTIEEEEKKVGRAS